jgi:hypothetical protein
MLSVGDSIADDRLEKGFEDTTGLFVDHGLHSLSVKTKSNSEGFTHGDTLDTSTTSKTTNGRLGDTLDVVPKNLAMALRTTFAEAFATFTTYASNQYVIDIEKQH